MKILVKKTRENAVMPKYAHEGDAGLDMVAAHVEYDAENDCYKYYTGIAFESPEQVLMLAMPRSSNYKTECYLPNGIGLIDTATYRGEIIFCYKPRLPMSLGMMHNGMQRFIDRVYQNEGDADFHDTLNDALKVYSEGMHDYFERANNLEFAPFKVGERIGQMVVLKHPKIKLCEVDELSETERGEGGFGSTGK